jgi:hypothetical protein
MTELQDSAHDDEAEVPSAPDVRDPVSPASAKDGRKLTPKRLVLTAIAVAAGVIGGTLIANALTNNSSGSDQAMGNWMSSYGSTYLAVSHDTAAVNSATNLKSLRTACATLQGDVTQAQSDPPMPLNSLESQWSAVLSNLSTSASDCVKGIDQQDSNLLDTAQSHMSSAGEAYLRLVKAVEQVP